MKAYITGASKGFGEALKKQLEWRSVLNEIVDLSRSTGFDLSEGVDDFVKDDFDVYFNNAHHGFAQIDLLYELFERNKNRRCLIVNVGSVSGDGDRKEINKYAVAKSALEKATTQLQLVPDAKCKVTLLKLGRMDTDMVKHINAPKMNVRSLAIKVLDNVVDTHFSGDSYIKTITFDIKGD